MTIAVLWVPLWLAFGFLLGRFVARAWYAFGRPGRLEERRTDAIVWGWLCVPFWPVVLVVLGVRWVFCEVGAHRLHQWITRDLEVRR